MVRRRGVLVLLLFVSGFAALVYQVLWVRELGLLFGSTAQAAALTIAVFFAGLGTGGWFWGRRAAGLADSLRGFGLLEVGVAITALGHFMLVDAYHAAYPLIHGLAATSPALDTLAKAVVAAVILFPPAFLMGGTLPLMGQHLVRHRTQLSRTGSGLYAVNTAGSAAGALAAGFVLPLVLGFDLAYLLAVALDLAVGATTVALARRATAVVGPPRHGPRAEPGTVTATTRLPVGLIWAAAFASGFAALAVEVIWTRLFAQVLQNSVYTYALILTIFLVALALGAGLANLLARLPRVSPERLLIGLLAGSALAAAAHRGSSTPRRAAWTTSAATWASAPTWRR